MQAFPTVQHFTLIFYNMNGLLSALDKNTCSPQSLATSSFWPGLQTLTLVNQSEYPNVTLVCSTIISANCFRPSNTEALAFEVDHDCAFG